LTWQGLLHYITLTSLPCFSSCFVYSPFSILFLLASFLFFFLKVSFTFCVLLKWLDIVVCSLKVDTANSFSYLPSIEFDFDEKPHVLAVDDSLIDRKVIERLLINSTCRGMKRTKKFWPFFIYYSLCSYKLCSLYVGIIC
jgi:hypothetical protein